MTFSGSWFGTVGLEGGAGPAGSFGVAHTLTISSGLATKDSSHKNLLIAGEGGVGDNLDRILGYAEGDMVVISPSDGAVSITVVDSVGMNLAGINFIMNDINDSMTLLNQGSDTWKELSRSGN